VHRGCYSLVCRYRYQARCAQPAHRDKVDVASSSQSRRSADSAAAAAETVVPPTDCTTPYTVVVSVDVGGEGGSLFLSLSLSLSRYRHENQYSTDCRRTSPGRGARGDLVRRPDVPAVAASRRPGADRFPAQSSFPRCRPSIRLIPGLRRAGERTCCFDWRSLPGAAATKGARSAGFDDPPPSTPQNTRRRRAPSDEVRFLKTSV